MGPQGKAGLTGIQGEIGPMGPQGEASTITIQTISNLGTFSPIIKAIASDGTSGILNALPLDIISASTSSSQTAWATNNTLTLDGTWWMSSIDSGNPEWVEYDFNSKVLLASVYASCTNGRNGNGVKIQASVDQSNWIDIHVFDSSKWIIGIDQMTYQNSIIVQSAYKYIRLYSDPTSYCMYDYIKYFGVI
jgi:hypothetical protein